MNKPIRNQYNPDYVSCPGETLKEILEEKTIPQAEFADRLEISFEHLDNIIQGKAAITPEIASQLERILNVSARFWLNYEKLYREHKSVI